MRARGFLLRSVQKIIGSRLPSEIGSVLATKLLLRAVVAKTNFESECLAFYKRRFGPLYMVHHKSLTLIDAPQGLLALAVRIDLA